MKVNITIPPSDVHMIMEKFLQSKFDGTASNLRPLIVEESVGYGMMERKAFVFKGYQCEVDMFMAKEAEKTEVTIDLLDDKDNVIMSKCVRCNRESGRCTC